MTDANIATRNEMKDEAMRRIREIHLHRDVAKCFAGGVRYLSEHTAFGVEKEVIFGELYWLTEEEEKMIRAFEARFKSLVYHAVKHNTEFGTQYALLYVTKYKDEWEMDWQDLKNNSSIAYVTDGSTGEIGTVGFTKRGSGLVRVW